MCAQSLSNVFVTLWIVACQAPLSMGFSRQEYWSRMPFPSPGDLPNTGIKPVSLVSPALAGRFFTTKPLGKSELIFVVDFFLAAYLETCSVQFSHSVMSDPLWLHRMQHTRFRCPSPTPRASSNSCSNSSVMPSNHLILCMPFSSCFQSCPASGAFPRSQFFISGGQSIGVSASVSVLPMNIHDWFSLGWTGWVSMQSKGLSRVFSNTTVWKHQFFSTLLSLWSNSHTHTWLLIKR